MNLPDGWKIVKLGDIATKIGSGITPKGGRAVYQKKGVPIIRSQNVLWGNLSLDDVARITIEQHQKMKSTLVKENDILLNITGASIGRCCFVPKGTEESNVNQHVCIIRLDRTNYPKYILDTLLSFQGQRQIALFQAGGNRQGLNFEQIASIELKVPSFPEQKVIADLLSTWDVAIEKTEQLITAKEKLLDAKVQRIFGSKFVSQKDWKTVELGSLFEEVSEKVGSQKLNPYSISAGVGFVSQVEKWGKNISGSQYSNYIHLRPGEFAYNKGNSKRYPQGCAYLLREGNICVPNVFIAFRTRNANVIPDFYAHYFIAGYHSRDLKKYITSGARADGLLNLNTKDFFKIHVPFPKLEEQKRIASFLDMMRRELELLKSLVKEYKFQKRGLMQKLLTGQWRVKSEIIKNYGDTAL